jgi:hypothetical protein
MTQLDPQIEKIVSELQQVARSYKLESANTHLFFKSLKDVTFLINRQLTSGISPLNTPFELESPPQSRISLPVVQLAEECLEGHRDGLFEVYCGFGLMRALASSPDHVETFNETGTAKVLSIVTFKFPFTPALLRYRSSVLLLDLLSFASVAETITAIAAGGKQDSVERLQTSKERSRSRSKNRNKKESGKRRSEDSSHKSMKPDKADRIVQSNLV